MRPDWTLFGVKSSGAMPGHQEFALSSEMRALVAPGRAAVLTA